MFEQRPGVKNKTTRMILTIWLDQNKLNKFSPRGDVTASSLEEERRARAKELLVAVMISSLVHHTLPFFFLQKLQTDTKQRQVALYFMDLTCLVIVPF